MSKQEFSIEKLIEEVKKRPCLYDTTNKEYKDKKTKDREWLAVCREVCKTNAVISDWEELNENERTDFLIEVKRKWSSLRDCFKRELRMIEKNEYKKRKYYFFDALQFLVPNKQCEVAIEYENVMDEEINIKQEIFNYDDESEQFVKNPLQEFVHSEITPDCVVQINTQRDYYVGENSQNESFPICQNKKRRCTESDDESYEKVDMKRDASENRTVNSEGLDDDQAFLQSILPTLRELNTEQKFRLRIEIMQTILKFKQENNT